MKRSVAALVCLTFGPRPTSLGLPMDAMVFTMIQQQTLVVAIVLKASATINRTFSKPVFCGNRALGEDYRARFASLMFSWSLHTGVLQVYCRSPDLTIATSARRIVSVSLHNPYKSCIARASSEPDFDSVTPVWAAWGPKFLCQSMQTSKTMTWSTHGSIIDECYVCIACASLREWSSCMKSVSLQLKFQNLLLQAGEGLALGN